MVDAPETLEERIERLEKFVTALSGTLLGGGMTVQGVVENTTDIVASLWSDVSLLDVKLASEIGRLEHNFSSHDHVNDCLTLKLCDALGSIDESDQLIRIISDLILKRWSRDNSHIVGAAPDAVAIHDDDLVPF